MLVDLDEARGVEDRRIGEEGGVRGAVEAPVNIFFPIFDFEFFFERVFLLSFGLFVLLLFLLSVPPSDERGKPHQ